MDGIAVCHLHGDIAVPVFLVDFWTPSDEWARSFPSDEWARFLPLGMSWHTTTGKKRQPASEKGIKAFVRLA